MITTASKLFSIIRQVCSKLIPYSTITSVMDVKPAISDKVINALGEWYALYTNNAPWLKEKHAKSLNLPAFVCSELARAITLELKWNITGKAADGSTKDENGEDITNERTEYLKKEIERNLRPLRKKLEQGLAAGGMTIKPYVKGKHIHFDWTMNWSLYPIAFDDDENLIDVVFKDCYTEEGKYYTRLERHTIEDDKAKSTQRVKITQRAFQSSNEDSLGKEVPLTAVDLWKDLQPVAYVNDVDGAIFGWFKVAEANNLDVSSPIGISAFHKAISTIRDADEQYSRFVWEFEGSELAVDIDPLALRPRPDGSGDEMPKHADRLFRKVDLGDDNNYHVFSPAIRDASLINGLNRMLTHVEDLCGLSRGTLTEAPAEARTATELNILKQRAYITVHDNQIALETCLRDAIKAMDVYATVYNLAPAGEYELSFEWDDSIITDMTQQLNERLALHDAGLLSDTEIRAWYLGETEAQARAGVEKTIAEQKQKLLALQTMPPPLEE